MTNGATPASSGTSEAPGFFSVLGDLFLDPTKALTALLKRPTVLLPLVLLMALHAGFTFFWLQRVDPIAFMKMQMQETGQWDKMPSDQRQGMLEGQAAFFPYFASIPLIAVPVITLLIAGVLTFIFRFFYAGEVTFKQGLSLTAWTSVPITLVAIPLLALVLHLKDDFLVNPQEVLQANPTLLVEKDSVHKSVYSFLSSLDLFSFWNIGLLAIGFGLACRKPASSTLWGVVTPWAVYVLVKSALAALF